ncbi:acyl-CoA thioesterase [Actinomadura pelletieri DSM 43383]|uniref:Acyl-CoA thioesterase n=1 Tax=Actinomadura pelletieri DSM 43383 TaxID=1120940 RepID=A0A495QTG4_9ACTN|nr:thioesterase family protein [Actinomadura pelletieri]RKS76810.1 acyl-CoA thioesterase [Actinomadura pelletieri DSM 43383]
MSGFGAATEVRRVGEGRFEAVLDGGYAIAGALNGGYLMAVLARAAVAASPHEHPVSTAATFLRVAAAGPAEVIVEPRKEGRTTATSLVTLVQDGRPTVDALITTGTLDADHEPAWSGAQPPGMPPLERCAPFEPVPETRDFAERLDLRFDPALMGWTDGRPSGRPELRAWLRLSDGHPPDPYSLALAVDALPPVTLNLGRNGWAPTVELTWHMRAVPAPGWLAVHGTGRLLTGGWFDEDVEVWDSTGRLVAQSRQLARAPRTPE